MTILYFAWVKEKVGLSQEEVTPTGIETVAGLMDWLATRSDRHASAFAERKLIKVAIDQVHAPHSAPIVGVKEIAFFPPVTGG